MFYLRARHGAKIHRTRIGVYGEAPRGMPLSEARRRAHEAAGARDRREGLPPRPGTFGELAAAFLRHRRAGGESRLGEVERILTADVLPALGERQAAEIRPADVAAILDAAVERGSPVQANRIRAHLARIFRFGLERELVESNPAQVLSRPARERSRDRVLSDAELVALWRLLEIRHPTVRHLFRVLLLTALRPGEARLLTWQDLDAWSLRIPAERTKARREHRLPLSPLAHAEIEAQRDLGLGGAFVFPSPVRPGEAFDPTSAAHAARKMGTALGFAFRPHDLRRTCATGLARLGASRETVRAVLNHADPDVTGRYDRHGREEEAREALDRWSAHVQALLEIGLRERQSRSPATQD